MSEQIDDGGPAFPHESYDRDADMDTVKPGMSLRDWFAGQALAGEMATWTTSTPDERAGDVARRVYLIADAMLAARRDK